MYLRRSSLLKYAIVALTGAALYSEWFVYLIQPWYWQGLECEGQNRSCTKILFVADPQIQGENEVPPPLSWLFNLDSDRYLKSTFSVVMNEFDADVVVFMGDLMDEGSIATIPQYYRYVERLADIFDSSHSLTVNIVFIQFEKMVWLPGDNDIGGENEPIKQDKVREFDRVFDQPSVIVYQNISIYKVNGITNTIPKVPEGDEDNFNMVVSHYPITTRQVFGQQVNKIHPHIIFCAHDHVSKYVKQNSDLTQREVFPYGYGSKVLDIFFDNQTLYEIYVPTCSYRMGTSKIGFGAAILENNNQQMKYTVFWSPQRFPYLFFYLAVLVSVSLYSMVFLTAKLLHRRSKMPAFSTDKQPLIDRI